MDMTVGQIIAIALVAAWGFPASINAFCANAPLILSPCIGAILGKPTLGLEAGAIFSLPYIGLIGIGGAVPPNRLGPAIFGTVWVCTTNIDMNTALALSLPVAVLIQFISIFLYSISSIAAKGVPWSLRKKNLFLFNFFSMWTFILYLVVGFIIGVAGCVSSMGISQFANSIPQWIINSFNVVGGLLPAVGFAIILSIMMKSAYIPFVFIAYICSAYFGMSIVGLAIVGVFFATLVVVLNVFSKNTAKEIIDESMISKEVVTDGI